MTKFKTALTKYGALPVATGLMTVTMAFPAWASESSSAVGPDSWAPVLQALTGQISVTTVVAVIAACIAAGIGLVFMWFGVRKLVRTLMNALRKGKMSV